MSMQYGYLSYGADPKVVTYTRPNVVVTTGKYCSIGVNVTFFIDGNHRYDTFSTFPFSEVCKWPEVEKNNWGKSVPVIQNDVWIGNGCTIYSGVTIHNGAVIAGNSVVTRDVPPYSIVAGNPARVKKFRFTPEQIEQLEALQWWDLPLETIRTELMSIMGNMDAVIQKLRDLQPTKTKEVSKIAS